MLKIQCIDEFIILNLYFSTEKKRNSWDSVFLHIDTRQRPPSRFLGVKWLKIARS